nr:PDDEXK nuclease domain-containing protein [Pseudorhodoferax sp. Leaf265]
MRPRQPASKNPVAVATPPVESAFAEVVRLIEQARQRAYQAVNTELVGLYWQIGEYISGKLAAAEWGEGVVDKLAAHLARTLPGQRGFTRRNLFRMRQFFETYRGDEVVSALLTQLPWTHNLLILSQAKRAEERTFYLRMAIQQRWGSRELERQLRLGAFDHAVLAPPKVSAALTQIHGDAAVSAFKDAYAVEFLNLPAGHTEADLHRGLLAELRSFLTELGRDFCFVSSEFPLQVGGRDFALDLLFFHRGLMPGGHRVEGRPLRTRTPGQAQLLPRSAGPRREEAAREPGHRPAAVRQQGQRGRRVRPEPHAVACAGGAVPDTAAGPADAGGQAARVLCAECA